MASKVSNPVETFLRWWGDELRGLMPRAQSAPRSRPGRRFVISVDGAEKRLLLESGGAIETLVENGPAGLADMAEFAAVTKKKPKQPVGLRFGNEDCFSRIVELPEQAEGDFARMLALDLERTTPFRSAEVMTAHYVLPGKAPSRGKLLVRHLVVKRRTLEPLLEEMRNFGIEPAFVDCWDEDRSGGLPVDFLAAARPQQARSGVGFVPVMALLAIVLAISAAAILIFRHQNALETLEAQAAAARSEATTVRLAVEASQHAAAQLDAIERLVHNRLPAARIIEELTVIIPDSAWVSDLRIDGDVVELTAFAQSAASILPLLEASPLFTAANLTSPVVLDSTEDKERFSVRLRLTSDIAVPGGTETVQHDGGTL